MFFTHSIFVFPSVSLLHPLPPPPLKKILGSRWIRGSPLLGGETTGRRDIIIKNRSGIHFHSQRPSTAGHEGIGGDLAL